MVHSPARLARHGRDSRGITLVEIGITLALISIGLVVMMASMTNVTVMTDRSTQMSIAQELANSYLADSLATPFPKFINLDVDNHRFDTVTMTEDGQTYEITYLLERQYNEAYPAGHEGEEGMKFLEMSVRVTWPAPGPGADGVYNTGDDEYPPPGGWTPVNEVFRHLSKSQDN